MPNPVKKAKAAYEIHAVKRKYNSGILLPRWEDLSPEYRANWIIGSSLAPVQGSLGKRTK